VRDAFAKLRANLPPGMQASVVADASVYIDAAIRDVLITILITLAVVVAVIFLFLGSWRSLV
jgi:multidrug efflux pump